MNIITIFLWIILILSLPPIGMAEKLNEPVITSDDLPRLRIEVQRLKETYRTKYIKNFEDFRIFESIGKAARIAPEMIDALIDLCEIKEAPSTTEKYSPASLSPASFELRGLGAVARPKVELALARKNLNAWQKAVLEQVWDCLARDEAEAKGLPPPPEYKPRYLSRSDFDYVTAETADILMSNPPPEWLLYQPAPLQPESEPLPKPETPPQAKAQISAKSQIQPSRKIAPAAEPVPSFSWWVAAAVAAVLVVSVAWLIRKRRK